MKKNTFHIKQKWERELKLEISGDIFVNISLKTHQVTNAHSWREFQLDTLEPLTLCPKQMPVKHTCVGGHTEGGLQF